MQSVQSKVAVASFALVLGFAGICKNVAHADDSKPAGSDKYLSLPNLTDEQKAKIQAIESMADAQIKAVLTDDQKTALGAETPAAVVTHETTGGTGGLYDDATTTTDGPIADRDYWQAKFDSVQLEQAIKDHQPEGAIGMQLISDISVLNDLLKKYPHHKEAQAWKARAMEVQKKIGDDFDRSGSFKAGCVYNNDSFMQAFVCYNTARMLMDDKKYDDAKGFLHLSQQKFDYLLSTDEDHMKDFSEDNKAWAREYSPKNKALIEECGKH